MSAIHAVMKPQYIKHPSAAEFRLVVQGFRDRWRFPQVAGAIDGTHIKISAPPDTHLVTTIERETIQLFCRVWWTLG